MTEKHEKIDAREITYDNNRWELFRNLRLAAIRIMEKFDARRLFSIVHGSVARGDVDRNSDIDILVDFEPEKENYDNYMAVYDILEHLFKNEKVEIVTKNGLSPYIGPKILNEVMYV